MAPICHGICNRFKPNWTGHHYTTRYSETVCRCSVCNTWLVVELGVNNNRCKCCNVLVRRQARKPLYKIALKVRLATQ